MQPLAALIGALLLTFSLGSVHAFSVVVAPFEARFAADRADISLTYSLALVCLTVAVLLGHRIYDRFHPALIGAGACLVAAMGLILAALAPSLALVYAGYGVLFGTANGIGYGFALIVAARAYPRRQGMAMGVVTASYAVGSIVLAQALGWVEHGLGLTWALVMQAAVVAGCGLVAAHAFRTSHIAMTSSRTLAAPSSVGDVRLVGLLWCGFGFGCAAGLMAISHAAGVVMAVGGSDHGAIAGVMLIGLGNAVGGFLIAWLADRLPLGRMLVGLPILSVAGLVALAFADAPAAAIALLGLVGLAYGAIIAVYPIATSFLFGIERTAKIYGIVFTAWGLAGFAGPWLAGIAFDALGAYRTALLLAAAAGVVSATAAWAIAAASRQQTRTSATPE
jgi:MFS transporter, OFA family, oxalate/formate antiporter